MQRCSCRGSSVAASGLPDSHIQRNMQQNTPYAAYMTCGSLRGSNGTSAATEQWGSAKWPGGCSGGREMWCRGGLLSIRSFQAGRCVRMRPLERRPAQPLRTFQRSSWTTIMYL